VRRRNTGGVAEAAAPVVRLMRIAGCGVAASRRNICSADVGWRKSGGDVGWRLEQALVSG